MTVKNILDKITDPKLYIELQFKVGDDYDYIDTLTKNDWIYKIAIEDYNSSILDKTVTNINTQYLGALGTRILILEIEI